MPVKCSVYANDAVNNGLCTICDLAVNPGICRRSSPYERPRYFWDFDQQIWLECDDDFRARVLASVESAP